MSGSFSTFDFDNDQRWCTYLRNVELIDSSPAALERLKIRWFKKNIDPSYEPSGAVPRPSSTSNGNASNSEETRNPEAATADSSQADGPRPRSDGNHASTGARVAPGRTWSSWMKSWMSGRNSSANFDASNMSNVKKEQQQRVFFMHVMLLMLMLFHLVPVLPLASCSLWCYWRFMQLAAFAQGYKIYANYGVPTGIWPFNWQQFSMWLSRVMATSTFFHFMTAIAFISTRSSITPAMFAITLMAGRSMLTRGNEYFGSHTLWKRTGAPAAAWATANASRLDLMGSASEVVLGFVLIMLLLTPARNVLLIFFYWQFLKVRFVTPDSAAGHRQVWQWLDEKTYPYRVQVPFIERGVQYVKGWFLNLGAMAGGRQ